MKITEEIKRLTISKNQSRGPAPPLGFVEVDEGNDGAGNNYGLYWEIGKEDKAPVVCWFDHDEYKLEVSFSNLSSFVRWVEIENKDDFKLGEEEEIFYPYYNRARLLDRRKKHEEAIKYLEHSVGMFGEYVPSWYLLSLQYLKTENIDQLNRCFPEILKANWAFGEPEEKSVEFMNEAVSHLNNSDDPIVKYYKKLKFENNWKTGLKFDFTVFKKIISEYHEQNDYLSVLKLKQNYGYAMLMQNKETIAKNSFVLEAWQNEFEEYSRLYLNERKYNC